MLRMPPRPPTWRRAFDTVERGVGMPLERLVRSERFFDVVTLATRSRSGVNRQLERVSRRALHLLNIPTATDVRRLSDQVNRMDRRVVAMRKDLSEDED
jgi:hypothetical protein